MTAHSDPLGIRLDQIVIDCPQPRDLAHFYSELLGWPIAKDNDEWASVRSPESTVGLAFQRDANYEPPIWNSHEEPQMKHLDFDVTDLDAQETRVLELGAHLVADNDRNPRGFRVYADPAGHFFCLCTEG